MNCIKRLKRRRIKVGDKLVEKGKFDEAIEAYEKGGLGETRKGMEKLADLYERVGKGRKAMELRRKIEAEKKKKQMKE